MVVVYPFPSVGNRYGFLWNPVRLWRLPKSLKLMTFRILHTSDWHLGHTLHDVSNEIVFVDQFEGLNARCHWLEFARIEFGKGDGKISICWLYEGPREEPTSGDEIYLPSKSMDLAVPEGWEYFGSLREFTNALNTEGPTWL